MFFCILDLLVIYFVKTISCANQQNLNTSLANRYKYLTNPINVINKFNICVYKHFQKISRKIIEKTKKFNSKWTLIFSVHPLT